MDGGTGNNMIERSVAEAVSYLRMRLDAAKLDTVDGLSKVATAVAGLIVFVVLATVGLLMLVGVLTFLLGLAIGSVEWAVVIVAACLIIIGLLVFVYRRNIFGNAMVAMFARIFFPADDKKGGADEVQ